MAIYNDTFIIPRPPFLGSGQWELQDLNEITVLFGKNGSGKSVLLRELVSPAPESRHLAIPERPGDITPNPGLVNEESLGVTRAGNRRQNTLTDYRNRAFARIQALLQKRGFHLKPGDTDDTINDIQILMKDLLPDFTFILTSDSPNYQLLRTDGTPVTNAATISSGEVGMLSLAVDLITICAMWKLEERPQRLLLIDEPDTHLHPDLQEYLASFLLRLVDKYDVQMVVATHSTTLLAALGFHGKERTSALYLNRGDIPQKAIKFTDHLQEISSCLGGHALMGPLFGAPLLLVEGDDDYRIWSQVPRHHIIKLAVLPCEGDRIYKYQTSLEQIFASLRTSTTPPAGYALLDRDKSLPLPLTTPQAHVAFLRLACHESENLYLSNEVLEALGITWDEAKAKIIARAGEFGNKKVDLLACDGWDKQTVDIKHLINELAVVIEPKNVHWTKRVGSAIGSAKPVGELAEFLGEPVMHALWA